MRAVVTVGAPSCPDHVLHLFTGIEDDGGDRVRVDIGGRPFVVGRKFLNDISLQPQVERLASLGRALLVMHSPTDETVGIDNARMIYDAARHPKSFVAALDGADHLLSRRVDSEFAADVIAAWAPRHLPTPERDVGAPRPRPPRPRHPSPCPRRAARVRSWSPSRHHRATRRA